MSQTQVVQALFFDVFGTVVDWRSSITRELSSFAQPRGLEADWPALADAWRARYQPAMEEVRAGRRTWVKLDTLHEENLDAVWRDFGLPALGDSERHELVIGWHRLEPWPDAVEGLTRLKARFIIAPVSNGNIALITNMAKRAGLPWDVVLGAEVARAYKPTPAAYLKSAAAIDLTPEQCMMVAAHNDDLAAASELGFATAFVPRPLEHGLRADAQTGPAGDWSIVAQNFLQLADQLGV